MAFGLPLPLAQVILPEPAAPEKQDTRQKCRSGIGGHWDEGIQLTRWATSIVPDMDVSKNTGTPKSFILIGFSIINHPFWGTPIFGNTHIYCLMGTPIYYYYPQKFPYSLYVTGEMTYIAPLYNWSYGPLLINGCLVPSCKKILS